MQPDDRVLIADMLDAADLAVRAAADRSRPDLEEDPILAAALERFIEIIGEAASKVSPETTSLHPEIPWRQVIGMRHRLVHGYASVDHDIVWDVVVHDLPGLIKALRSILR
jgi:uncharacterized protein with HEPN domain